MFYYFMFVLFYVDKRELYKLHREIEVFQVLQLRFISNDFLFLSRV